MAETFRQQIGKRGEDEACAFLIKQGFVILERNYWKPWGEIDIVARRKEELRFVEVKTVSRDRGGELGGEEYEPEDNIHPWKRQRLRRVIETYLLGHPDLEALDWQIDALSLYLDRQGMVLQINHLEDIDI